jgi:hypothetical protein
MVGDYIKTDCSDPSVSCDVTSPSRDRFTPQVVAVQLDQVEGVEEDTVVVAVVANEIDRDRGEPRGPSPPTPPCVRVRTRRFEKLR